MKIPKELKILAHTYKVQEVSGIGDNGVMSDVPLMITIDKDLPDTIKGVTLLHEIIHAINGEIPETEVDWLAQTLFQVLNDNKII